MIQLWISGRIPSKKNSKQIVQGRGKARPRLISSSNYLLWEKLAILEIKIGWQNKTICKCESITYDFYFPDKRVRDLSNSIEGVNDALVSAKVLLDDKWQITGSITMNPHLAENKERAGVMITFNGVEYE